MTENRSLIIGSVTRQGTYADNKDMCELIISKDSFNKLPHSPGEEKQINLSIGDTVYKAKVHENKLKNRFVRKIYFN